jgi:hypothetical protein
MLNHCVPVDDATVKRLSVSPAWPVIESAEDGVEEPIPMLPLASIMKSDAPEDDATANGLLVPAAFTESVATGVPVPIPRRVLVLSQKKLELFCERSPLVVTNGIDPAVSPER